MDLMTKYRNIYNSVSGNQSQEEINRTLRLENEADVTQRKVMNGQCQIIDFSEAAKKWKAAGLSRECLKPK